MRLFAWLTAAVGAVLTLCYLLTGPGGDGDWVNGFLAGPFLLLFLLPDLLSLAGSGTPSGKSGSRTPASTARRSRSARYRRRTGLSVSDQPQLDILLDVDTEEGHSFRAVARRIVDLTELSRLTPGVRLPVRYLPGQTTAGEAARVGRGPGPGRWHGWRRPPTPPRGGAAGHRPRPARPGGGEREITARQLRIAEEGRDAQAVVVAMTPTGEVREGRAVVRLTLRVTRPDGSVFDSTQEKHLPAGLAPGLQPGTVVPVRYLPEAESEVVVLLRPHP